jgi:hypothetical protein
LRCTGEAGPIAQFQQLSIILFFDLVFRPLIATDYYRVSPFFLQLKNQLDSKQIAPPNPGKIYKAAGVAFKYHNTDEKGISCTGKHTVMAISVHNRAFLSNCLNSWCVEAIVLICGTVDLFLLILLMDDIFIMSTYYCTSVFRHTSVQL